MMRIVTKEKADFTRKKIIDGCRQLFYECGYSKVTMDQAAKKLGMSKKTLYRYFDSKEAIMSEVTAMFSEELGSGVEAIVSDQTLDYPLKLKKMLNFVALKLSGISITLMEDLQKNLPRLWDQLNHYKKEGAFKRFNRLIDEGVEKGMINERVNKRLIVALYACAIQNLLDPDFVRQMPSEIVRDMPHAPSTIFDNMINIIYEGILTERAKNTFRLSE